MTGIEMNVIRLLLGGEVKENQANPNTPITDEEFQNLLLMANG